MRRRRRTLRWREDRLGRDLPVRKCRVSSRSRAVVDRVWAIRKSFAQAPPLHIVLSILNWRGSSLDFFGRLVARCCDCSLPFLLLRADAAD